MCTTGTEILSLELRFKTTLVMIKERTSIEQEGMIRGWHAMTDGIEMAIMNAARSGIFNRSVMKAEDGHFVGGPANIQNLSRCARAIGLNVQSMFPPVNGMDSYDFQFLNYTAPFIMPPKKYSPDIKVMWTGFGQFRPKDGSRGDASSDHFIGLLLKNKPKDTIYVTTEEGDLKVVEPNQQKENDLEKEKEADEICANVEMSNEGAMHYSDNCDNDFQDNFEQEIAQEYQESDRNNCNADHIEKCDSLNEISGNSISKSASSNESSSQDEAEQAMETFVKEKKEKPLPPNAAKIKKFSEGADALEDLLSGYDFAKEDIESGMNPNTQFIIKVSEKNKKKYANMKQISHPRDDVGAYQKQSQNVFVFKKTEDGFAFEPKMKFDLKRRKIVEKSSNLDIDHSQRPELVVIKRIYRKSKHHNLAQRMFYVLESKNDLQKLQDVMLVEYVGDEELAGSSEVPHGNFRPPIELDKDHKDLKRPYLKHDKDAMEHGEELLSNGMKNKDVLKRKRDVMRPTKGLMKMKTVKYLARKIKQKVKEKKRENGGALNMADEITIIVNQVKRRKSNLVKKVIQLEGDEPPIILLATKWQLDAIKRYCVSTGDNIVNVLGVGKFFVCNHCNMVFAFS